MTDPTVLAMLSPMLAAIAPWSADAGYSMSVGVRDAHVVHLIARQQTAPSGCLAIDEAVAAGVADALGRCSSKPLCAGVHAIRALSVSGSIRLTAIPFPGEPA